MIALLRKYFISGLLVWLPIWITLLVFSFLLGIFNSIVNVLPVRYQPDQLLGFHFPGVSLLIILIIIIGTGSIAANIVGQRIVELWDSFVVRIPLVRSIYTGVKQVVDTLFSPGGQSFRKVLLVEYPRDGVWTIAFQTGDTFQEIEQVTGGGKMVSLFVPTTPNPTSGFLLMVPKNRVIELAMSVDQALKFVISLGVVQPINNNGSVIKKNNT